MKKSRLKYKKVDHRVYKKAAAPLELRLTTTKLVEALPKDLQTSLPTIEQIEAHLSRDQRTKS